MNIRPLHDRILVKRLEGEERSSGGIYIPDTAKEKPAQGLVVGVGEGKTLDDGTVRPLQVKAGDKILFSKYAGTELKLDDADHLVIREDDVLGIISD